MFSSFPSLVDALQGPAEKALDEEERAPEAGPDGNNVPGSKPGRPKAGAAAEGGEEQGGGVFNLWGMASVLAENVKKGTAELAASVAETDWRAEVEAFGRGVREERSAAQQRSLGAVREGLGHLERGLPPGAELDPAAVTDRLTQVGSRLRGLGASLVHGAAELVDQVQEAIAVELEGMEGQLAGRTRAGAPPPGFAGGAGIKYSRLEAEISAMQRCSATYCDEPEDAEEFAAWLAGFDLDAHKDAIAALIAENAFMAELQARIVPLIVAYDTFWTRYFYQLHRLRCAHEARQALAARATAAHAAEQEVSWDDEEPSGSSGADAGELQPASPPPPATAPRLAAVRPEDISPETSTASEDSAHTAPWTVVTSPPPPAPLQPAAPPLPAVLEVPATSSVAAPPALGGHEGSATGPAEAPVASREPGAGLHKPAASLAGVAAGVTGAVTAAYTHPVGAGEPAKAPEPKSEAVGASDAGGEEEISDVDSKAAGAAEEGGADSDVDEDWGGDWE